MADIARQLNPLLRGWIARVFAKQCPLADCGEKIKDGPNLPVLRDLKI